jgi:hypothetical protein
MIGLIAARWGRRATKVKGGGAGDVGVILGPGHRPAIRKLHEPRTIPTQALVDRVLGLRVLIHQHVQGETPFARVDIADLTSALDRFVGLYELDGTASVASAVTVETAEAIEGPLAEVPPVEAPAAKSEPFVDMLPPVEPEPAQLPVLAVAETIDPPFELPAKPQRVKSAPPARCVAVTPAQPSSRITLRAMDAAERFVEWVRLAGRCATYASQDLTKLYREHCEAEDLVVLADNILRPALLRVEGVTKLKSDSGRNKRERVRHFLWRIDPAKGATVGATWQQLPQSTGRRVA